MSWFQTGISVISAVTGGFVGGWVVAFRLGRWRQRVEDRLEGIEHRLADGDKFVGMVPVVNTRLEMMLEELREIRKALRDARTQFVTHEECDRRHG
jgi:hypothetical protein